MYILIFILLLIVTILTSFLFIFLYFYDTRIKEKFLKQFHSAILNIYNKAKTSYIANNAVFLEQLTLNYEKLCQEYPDNKFISILDVLKTLVHYYDCISDNNFKRIFEMKKELEIEEFIMNICLYIEEETPFISIPQKEANLMQHIYQTLKDNDIMSEKYMLKQLSQEIEMKEKMMAKMNKTNKITIIISVLGVIFTFLFGIASLF